MSSLADYTSGLERRLAKQKVEPNPDVIAALDKRIDALKKGPANPEAEQSVVINRWQATPESSKEPDLAANESVQEESKIVSEDKDDDGAKKMEEEEARRLLEK